MDRKTFIDKIKLMLNIEDKVEVKQLEAKLKDGSSIMVEPELAIGANVANANGEVLPDGMYELEDNSKINVQSGLIIELIPFVEEAIEQKEETPTVEFATKEELNSLVTAINELKEKINLSFQAQIEFSSELDSYKNKAVDEKIIRKEEAKDKASNLRAELKKLDPDFERMEKLYSNKK